MSNWLYKQNRLVKALAWIIAGPIVCVVIYFVVIYGILKGEL